MGLQPLESIPKPEFEDATEEDRERVRVDSCWSEVRCKGHPCDGLQVEPTPTSPGISRGEDVYEVEDPEEEKSPEEFFDEDQDTDRELVLIDVFEKFGVLECGYRCAALRALLDKKSGRKSLILAKKLIEKDLRSYVNGLPEDWDSV